MFSFLPGLAEQLTRQVETPEEARAAIAELDRARVDLVKLVLEPGFEDRPLPRLREEVFRAAMAEAKARRMRTTVHVGTDADVRLAIDAGANGIEHTARGLSDETIAMMAAKRVTFTPTNVVLDWAWKRRSVARRGRLVRRLAMPAILQSLARSEVAAGADASTEGETADTNRCRRLPARSSRRREPSAPACRSSPDRTPAIP